MANGGRGCPGLVVFPLRDKTWVPLRTPSLVFSDPSGSRPPEPPTRTSAPVLPISEGVHGPSRTWTLPLTGASDTESQVGETTPPVVECPYIHKSKIHCTSYDEMYG